MLVSFCFTTAIVLYNLHDAVSRLSVDNLNPVQLAAAVIRVYMQTAIGLLGLALLLAFTYQLFHLTMVTVTYADVSDKAVRARMAAIQQVEHKYLRHVVLGFVLHRHAMMTTVIGWVGTLAYSMILVTVLRRVGAPPARLLAEVRKALVLGHMMSLGAGIAMGGWRLQLAKVSP
jgi:hypothetical protein